MLADTWAWIEYFLDNFLITNVTHVGKCTVHVNSEHKSLFIIVTYKQSIILLNNWFSSHYTHDFMDTLFSLGVMSYCYAIYKKIKPIAFQVSEHKNMTVHEYLLAVLLDENTNREIKSKL